MDVKSQPPLSTTNVKIQCITCTKRNIIFFKWSKQVRNWFLMPCQPHRTYQGENKDGEGGGKEERERDRQTDRQTDRDRDRRGEREILRTRNSMFLL